MVCGVIVLPVAPALASPGQTVTDLTALTPADLVQSLVGGGVMVSNVSYTGDDRAAGTFEGFEGIGIGSGVVLSSGSVAGPLSAVIGPNTVAAMTTIFGTPGDADLDAIIAPQTTYDAAVLEFDVVPATKELTFTYVFGSEEYNDYVGTMWNDPFALLVNGVNCAVVDTGSGMAPITINTINNNVNSSLFIDNADLAAPVADTQMNGFTKPLTCRVEVTPGVPNHLKFAIADGSDELRDSSVLIEAGSLNAIGPPVATPQSASTPAGQPVEITLAGIDPDGRPIAAYTVVDGPQHGTLTQNGSHIVYTPDPGFTGTDAFTYTVGGGALESEPAAVIIDVIPAAVAPGPVPTDAVPSDAGPLAPIPLAGGGAVVNTGGVASPASGPPLGPVLRLSLLGVCVGALIAILILNLRRRPV